MVPAPTLGLSSHSTSVTPLPPAPPQHHTLCLSSIVFRGLSEHLASQPDPFSSPRIFPDSASIRFLTSSPTMLLCKLLLTFLAHTCAGGSASLLPRQEGHQHQPSGTSIALGITLGPSKICFTLLRGIYPYPRKISRKETLFISCIKRFARPAHSFQPVQAQLAD